MSFVVAGKSVCSSCRPLCGSGNVSCFVPLVGSVTGDRITTNVLKIIRISGSNIFGIFSPLVFSLCCKVRRCVGREVSAVGSRVRECGGLSPNLFSSVVYNLRGLFNKDTGSSESVTVRDLEGVRERGGGLRVLSSLSSMVRRVVGALGRGGLVVKFWCRAIRCC